MKKNLLFLLLFFFLQNAFSQNSSLFSDRIRYPKLTSIERKSLNNPEAGDTVYDTNFNALFVFDGKNWTKIKSKTVLKDVLHFLGETQYGNGFDVAVDKNENIYLGGFTTGQVIMGATTITAGLNNLFLAKFNPAGLLLWSKSFGGTDEEQMGDLDVDDNGNVYFTGNFRSNFTNGGTTFTGSSSDFDVFLSKFDTDGNHLWSVREQGTGSFANSNKVVIDPNGNATISGYFGGSSTFQSTTITPVGNQDIFLAQYNSTGTLNWVKSFGGSGQESPQDLQLDATGNVLLAGQFAGTATLGSASISSYGGGLDTFVLKLDSSGNAIWARAFGGFGGEQEIKANFTSNGDIIIATKLDSDFTFQGRKIYRLSNSRMFLILNLTSSGDYKWHALDGRSDNVYGIPTASFIGEKNGQIYLVGNVSYGTVYFGDDYVNAATSNPFVVTYDTSTGDFNWVNNFNSTNTLSAAYAKTSRNGDIILSGVFKNQIKYKGITHATSTLDYGLFYQKIQ